MSGRGDAGRRTGASEAWLQVSEELLRGANHALSNRLAALGAVVRVLEHRPTAAEPLIEALGREVERLEELGRLLQLLPHERDRGAEAIHLPELLREAAALHGMQGPLRDMSYDIDGSPDTLPVWSERSRLLHVVLLLLSTAARATQLVADNSLTVRYTGDESWVTVIVESGTASSSDPQSSIPPRAEELLGSIDLDAIAEMLGDGGKIAAVGESAEGAGRWELRLPTLLEARRRGS